jgi:AcrR family transcriptional regulator
MRVRKNTLIRRKEIVSAAGKLIVKYGSENVSLRRVAEEIGVSEANIYRHFKNKRDVLSFLVDDVKNSLISEIDHCHSGEIDSLKQLEDILMKHISYIE